METEKVFLRPIKNTPIVQRVIDRLTQAMINKELRPGDRLPTEFELSASFGVGRNSVREAVKVLNSFGVLDIRRPEGTFVAKSFSDKMIDPLLYGIILDQNESLDSLKELREWIDIGTLKLATLKATEEDIESLSDRLDDLKEKLHSDDVDAIFKADDEFHSAIFAASHNSLMTKIAELVRKLTIDIRIRTIRNMKRLNKLNEMEQAHEVLYQAVAQHDIDTTSQPIVDGYFYHYGVLDTDKLTADS